MEIVLKKIDMNILKYLTYNHNVSIKDISKSIKKSETTVRSSLKRINQFLIEHELNPLEKIGVNYTLSPSQIKNLNIFSSKISLEITQRERFNYLVLELVLTEKLNLNEKSKIFGVSRKTLSLDLEELKNFLKENNLALESVPWKGIYLKGNNYDKITLAVQFIMKIHLEQEINESTIKTQKVLLNPLINKLYREYIPKKIEILFYNLTKQILNKYKIEAGTYFFYSFFAISIYAYLKKDNTLICNSFQKNISSEIENLCKEYSKYFKSKSFLSKYPSLEKNINLLAGCLSRMNELFFIIDNENNQLYNKIISDVENYFDINFSKKLKIYFIQTLGISIFKFRFRIKKYNSCFSKLSRSDKNILDDLNTVLYKNNFSIYDEDLILLALLIKEEIINNRIFKINNIHILILDCTYNCWLGNIIATQLKNNFNNIIITIKSLYLTTKNEILNSNPDFIIYTDFEFNKFFSDIHIKKYQIKYINLFKYMDYFKELGLFEKEKYL